ncbi:MAG: hypothetical protein QGG87_00665, partial [Nitrospinota bacterium]|nr:hypothetical protein [Nitrospinota bacterium]
MPGNKLKNLNILSFNWHEPYLCLLAQTSHRFTIVEPEVREGFIRRWKKELRPVSQNITLMDKADALSNLEAGTFDLAICQNVKDLLFIKDFLLPKILVFHNKLSTEIALGRNQVKREEYLAPLKNIFSMITLVFISENKRKDWGFDGRIINPGIDVEAYEDYSGDIEKVLRKTRDVKKGEEDFEVTTPDAMMESVNSILGAIQAFIIIIAS